MSRKATFNQKLKTDCSHLITLEEAEKKINPLILNGIQKAIKTKSPLIIDLPVGFGKSKVVKDYILNNPQYKYIYLVPTYKVGREVFNDLGGKFKLTMQWTKDCCNNFTQAKLFLKKGYYLSVFCIQKCNFKKHCEYYNREKPVTNYITVHHNIFSDTVRKSFSKNDLIIFDEDILEMLLTCDCRDKKSDADVSNDSVKNTDYELGEKIYTIKKRISLPKRGALFLGAGLNNKHYEIYFKRKNIPRIYFHNIKQRGHIYSIVLNRSHTQLKKSIFYSSTNIKNKFQPPHFDDYFKTEKTNLKYLHDIISYYHKNKIDINKKTALICQKILHDPEKKQTKFYDNVYFKIFKKKETKGIYTYGNTKGINELNQCNIIVIGGPRLSEEALTAKYFALTGEKLKNSNYKRNHKTLITKGQNGGASFSTFLQSSKILSELELSFAKNQIMQAIGRARTLRFENIAFYLGVIPIHEYFPEQYVACTAKRLVSIVKSRLISSQQELLDKKLDQYLTDPTKKPIENPKDLYSLIQGVKHVKSIREGVKRNAVVFFNALKRNKTPYYMLAKNKESVKRVLRRIIKKIT